MVPNDRPRLEWEKDFHHPYQPYDIQKQFMSTLYQCIEQGNIGIFESPTGTGGKSLSLICGSLTWLRDHKRKVFEDDVSAETADDDEPEWMLEHARASKRSAVLQKRADLESRLAIIRAREEKAKHRFARDEPLNKRLKVDDSNNPTSETDDDAQFLLDDYESDGEEDKRSKVHSPLNLGLSAETQALMQKLGFLTNPQPPEDEAGMDELKIFYCSRTHSQLSQFANELRRVKLPPAIPPCDHAAKGSGSRTEPILREELKYLTLGSRRNLCINPRVKKLRNATAINEGCLELQQPKTSKDAKCPFLPAKDSEALTNDFQDHALARIQDIEDLGVLGKKLGICPYYASRSAMKPCEIVALPYPLLLQKSAREALGLSVKDHVVIIDEAHNLMDAITTMYSISVSLAQLQRSRAQLGIYLQKFRNRLKGKNRVYLSQTVRLIDSLALYLQSKCSVQGTEGLVQVSDLMTGKGVDQINTYKLARYLQESKVARKVDGYVVHAETQYRSAATNQNRNILSMPRTQSPTVPVLTHIQSFLLTLMNPSSEGRFFFSTEEDGSILLKYMLLDPTYQFKEIVEEARAVILAGGTMSPMSDYFDHLFSYLPPSKITTLSCGHVVPTSHLFACPVMRGPSGVDFDFTFGKRHSERMISDLGLAIQQFSAVIPDGVVVFFPSYSYLDTCVAAWKKQKNSSSQSTWSLLGGIKPIFLEARSGTGSPIPASTQPTTLSAKIPQASSTEGVLSAYKDAIKNATPPNRGALLLAVIGGSLSEGINFSDSLGRGVIVVGLPFPNPHSVEWKAKLQYITTKVSEQGPLSDEGITSGKGASSEGIAKGQEAARHFYENACMRAVNQCIGRAIRHRADYASILLIDRRYSGERIRDKLPGWIKEGMAPGQSMEDAVKGLEVFFVGKKAE